MEHRVLGTARQWSSESCVSDHVDLQATAMDLDSMSGTSILLAGKKCLALINISDESEPSLELKYKRSRSQPMKWDVNEVLFNRNDRRLAAMTSYNVVDVLRVEESSVVEYSASLKGHCRVVSDLDWSNDNLLASASIDTLVNLWDLRQSTEHPALCLSCIVPASLVKCGRSSEDGHLVITTHEGDIKVWDLRRPQLPLHYITAHTGRILSVDWHQSMSSKIVSSGRECSLKFFQINENNHNCIQQPKLYLETALPVWKAKFTPFYQGLATVVLPQSRHSENSLFLWNTTHLEYPVHCFCGHRDVILNFGWRQVEHNDLFQMVTWSRDHTLRVWNVDSRLQRLCGDEEVDTGESGSSEHSSPIRPNKAGNNDHDHDHDNEDSENTLTPNRGRGLASKMLESNNEEAKDELQITTTTQKQATLLWAQHLEECQKHCNQPQSSVKISEVSLDRRSCRLSLQSPLYKAVHIRVHFPKGDLVNGRPRLTVDRESALDSFARNRLLKHLRSMMTPNLSPNQSVSTMTTKSVNPNFLMMVVDGLNHLSVRSIVSLNKQEAKEAKESSKENEEKEGDEYEGFIGSGVTWGRSSMMMEFPQEMHFDPNNVPAAKSCGAVFCGNDFLLCFGTAHTKRAKRPHSRFASPTLPTTLPTSSAKVLGSVVQGRFSVKKVGDTDDTEETKTNALLSTHRQFESGRSLIKKVDTTIHVLNVSKLSPFKRVLAKNYVLMAESRGSLDSMFVLNAHLAHRQLPRRPDVARIWLLCGQMAGHMTPRLNEHPMGKGMFVSMVKHLVNIGDSQTLASIFCLLAQVEVEQKDDTDHHDDTDHDDDYDEGFAAAELLLPPRRSHKSWLPKSLRDHVSTIMEQSVSSPYHTIHSTKNLVKSALKSEPNLEKFIFSPPTRGVRSNSWSDATFMCSKKMSNSLNNAFTNINDVGKTSLLQHLLHTSHLTSILQPVMLHYVSILTHWQLLQKRAQLLKLLDKPQNELHRHQKRRGARRRCALCQLPVRGLEALCVHCGHGGHLKHWQLWFQASKQCPVPICQCQCTRHLE